MSRVSTKVVLEALQEAGVIESWSKSREFDEFRNVHETVFKVVSDKLHIGHEIYGKDAQMYFTGKGTSNAHAISHADEARKVVSGFSKLDEKWMGRSRREHFCIGVTFFKGSRWWE